MRRSKINGMRLLASLWSPVGLIYVILGWAALRAEGTPRPLPESTPWNLYDLREVPQYEWLSDASPVRSLKYEAMPHKGQMTSVFAYYASPRAFGFDGRRFPAMVLVHGGGGRAFEKWVTIWAERGYVAIAMDLAGRGKDGVLLEDGGPDQGHEQKFGTIDQPLENQWSYHAVANVILAHSLIRGFDDVDTSRVGLTGISWGGYLTCIVAGLDDRFKFAMPVYGCGFLHQNSVWKASEFARMTDEQAARWVQLWDPSSYLGSTKIPIVFLNGTHDFAYPMDSYAKTLGLVQTDKRYSIQFRMRHGHLFDFPEFFAYADEYLTGGTAVPRVLTPRVEGDQVMATFESPSPVAESRLYYTVEPHQNNEKRRWDSIELSLSESRVTGKAAPAEATAWYIELKDSRGLTVSSEVIISP